MSLLPARYAWLDQEPAPRMLLEALKLYGTLEAPGAADNPTILKWAQEVGLQRTYTHDAVPWCGLFMALVAQRAGKPIPDGPLWALNWATWGDASGQPMLGDVLVFVREGGGHVGLYVGEDRGAFHVLGGNTGDAVSIARIAKQRLHAARRYYTIAAPPNVRPVLLAVSGALSTNEA